MWRLVAARASGALIGKLGEGSTGCARDTCDPHHLERTRCHGRDAGRPCRGACRDPHRLVQRTRLGRHQIHAPTCPSASSMRSRNSVSASTDHIVLQLAGNPLGLSRDEAIIEQSSGPRTAVSAGQCRVVVAVLDRCLRFVRPRSKRAGRGGDGGVCRGVVDQIVRQRCRGDRQALQCDALERGALRARRDVRRVTRRPGLATDFDRAGRQRFLAGEATHEMLWGTVDGAWESGERAADAALKNDRRAQGGRTRDAGTGACTGAAAAAVVVGLAVGRPKGAIGLAGSSLWCFGQSRNVGSGGALFPSPLVGESA